MLENMISHYTNGNKAKFANILGVSPQTISAWISRNTFDSELIYTKCSDISSNWLLTGRGDMLINEEKQVQLKGKAVKATDLYVEVPYISKRATASFVESLYNNDPECETYPVIPQKGENINSNDFCVFEVYGDSMTPTINQGALVLAKQIKEEKWEYAEGVVIVVFGKSLVIKRIKKNNLFINNTILLCSDNPLRGEVLVERAEIRAIYKAKRIISENIL